MNKNERKTILEGYRAHSVNNEIEIIRSKKCGCYFCKKTYSARKVKDWEQGENGRASAICPECGMSTVIGDASGAPLTKELLEEMNKAFYGKAKGEKKPVSAEDYVDRYLDGKIPENKKNEDLFLSYCKKLAEEGDANAYLILGDYAGGKARFREPNCKAAYAYYSNPLLHNDVRALCEKGRLAIDGFGAKKNKMEGYECFAKAAALGSLEAVYLLADCYHYGYPVPIDDSFAIRAIIGGLKESYSDFLDFRICPNSLPEFAYRLGKSLQNGWGIEKEETFALRYYLICQFATFMRAAITHSDQRPSFFDDLLQQMDALAAKIGAKSGEPLYDTDTFFDTYGDPNTRDPSAKKFKLISYSKESNELVFEIESDEPGLLIDTANLYCNLNKPKIRWTFNDVASFTQNGESDFDDVVVTEDGYQFVRCEEEAGDIVIAEIALIPNDSSDEEEQEAIRADEGE